MAVSEKYSKFSKTRRTNLKGKASGYNVYTYSGMRDCLYYSANAYATTPFLTYGTTLYYDPELTTLYTQNWGDFFKANGFIYKLDEDSKIILVANEIQNYRYRTFDSCGSSTVLGEVWLVNASPPTVGTAVYTACYEDISVRADLQSYYINSSRNDSGPADVYITVDGSGLISNITPCE